MDFNETVADVTRSTIAFHRPYLSTEKQVVYEDSHRSDQVMNEMHRFYQIGRLCDVVLDTGETSRYPCHRLVLAASSVYFERMFSNDMTEAHASEIRLNDVPGVALQHLIEFAYTSKLTVSKDSVLETFEAADMLQFPKAREFCQEFLLDQIDTQNCLSFLTYADAFSCTPLYEKAMLCAAKNFQLICRTREFLELPVSHLAILLTEDNIEIEYEEYIYEALKRWILHDEDARFAQLARLFRSIRLNFVSRWYLIEVISKDPLLGRSCECNKLVQSAKDQLLAQGHTYEIPWQLPPSRRCTGLTWKIVYVNTYDPNPGESEIYLFDVVNKSWSNTSKPCPMASELSTCCSVGDSLLIIGGWTNRSGTKSLNQRGAVNVVHEFKVMQIFPTLWYIGVHQMGVSRYLHTTVTAGNQIYLLGGYDETQSLQASAFVTDAARGYKFDVCPRMLYPVSRPAAAVWEDKLYVFGGFGDGGVPRQFVQCFDMASQKWTEVVPGFGGVYTACHYAVNIAGVFYVVCGETASLNGAEHVVVGHRVAARRIDAVHTFCPVARLWTRVFRFAEPRAGSFSIATLGERIYITGGTKNGTSCYTIECFDPRGNAMETVGSAREGSGILSLCATMKVMHENFGL